MKNMLITRVLRGILTVFLATLLVFMLLRVIPGDAATILAGPEATQEEIEAMREAWGLNQPLMTQFIIYIKKLVTGDVGMSYAYRTGTMLLTPASTLVWTRIPNTLLLALTALVITVVAAVPIGVYTAKRPGGLLDNFINISGFVLKAFPLFFVGIILMMVFGLRLKWLPTGGTGSFIHLILPAVTLSAHEVVTLTRLTRTEVGRVMRSDHIRTARAKGLSSNVVLYKHALRNVSIPLITNIGLRLGKLINGAVVVETLFRWPGIGSLLVTSLNGRDYPVIQVLIPYAACVFVVVNLLVDLLYGVLDPRVTHK
ncbi:ABC transporter permease [Enterocloster lavalensis]|uniref:ABC transporter permease n=1 Tax=Enterocloster lavalensis TaxID=460384 RepID=UPI0034A572B8